MLDEGSFDDAEIRHYFRIIGRVIARAGTRVAPTYDVEAAGMGAGEYSGEQGWRDRQHTNRLLIVPAIDGEERSHVNAPWPARIRDARHARRNDADRDGGTIGRKHDRGGRRSREQS